MTVELLRLSRGSLDDAQSDILRAGYRLQAAAKILRDHEDEEELIAGVEVVAEVSECLRELYDRVSGLLTTWYRSVELPMDVYDQVVKLCGEPTKQRMDSGGKDKMVKSYVGAAVEYALAKGITPEDAINNACEPPKRPKAKRKHV